MTDTLTRDEVQRIIDLHNTVSGEVGGPVGHSGRAAFEYTSTVLTDAPRLAAAYLALLDQYEEALEVVREMAEPVALGAAYHREWDKRIARTREFLQRVEASTPQSD